MKTRRALRMRQDSLCVTLLLNNNRAKINMQEISSPACCPYWDVLFNLLCGDGGDAHGFGHGLAHFGWVQGDFGAGVAEGVDLGIGGAGGFAAGA